MSSQGQVPVRVEVVNPPASVADPATATNQATLSTRIGATDESAAASDTAASGLNGLLKRIAQRLTSSSAGAATIASGQVTTNGSAQTLVAARATRRSVSIVNTSTLVTAYIGPATVTSGNGHAIPPGSSIESQTTALIQVIGTTGAVVTFLEEYD